MNNEQKKSFAAMCFMIIVAVLIFLGCWYIWSLHEKGTNYSPNPTTSEKIIDSDGFPAVDWDYWQSINSDIVGWVTIPDTQIDYPVVQAHEDDPHYYLTHDIYNDWNYTGAIYVDSECEYAGIDKCQNVVILGHNMGMGDGTLFEPLTNYINYDFANTHQRILFQTPTKKVILNAYASENINGNRAIKQTSFSTMNEFQQYIADRFDASDIRLLDNTPIITQLFTLCTCSYNFNPSNERTLVYAEKKVTL